MATPLCIFAVTSKLYESDIFNANLVALSIMSLFTLINDIGLYQYYVKRFNEVRLDKNKSGWLLGVAFGQKIITCMVCVLIIFLLTFLDNYRDIVSFLIIGSIGAIFQAFQPIWYYNGIEKMSIYATANIGAKILSLLLMWILLTFYKTDYVPVICFTFANILLTLYLLFDVKRHNLSYKKVILKDLFNLISIARFYIFSRTLSAISTYLIVIVLGATSLSLAGVFAIADQIYKSIKLSISAVIQVLIPFSLRSKNTMFLIYITVAVLIIALLIFFLIDLVLIDVVTFIWGSVPFSGHSIIYLYTYAGILAMLNALLGFPWFGNLGFYDKANTTLVWATVVTISMLLYAFYQNNSLLAYIVLISESSLLIFRLFHLSWLKFK
jgi:PST family polysaccharide transporter